MRRFSMNRWWAFILALFVSVAGIGSLPLDVRADDPGSSLYGDGTNDGRTPNTPPPPTGTGDPDFPSTPGKQGSKPGAQRLGSPAQFGISASGEGTNANTAVWMMRFRVAMRMLRAYYQR